MNRSTLRSVSVVLASAVVSLWPLAAGAQPAPAGSMTAGQVRDQFVSQGFLTHSPVSWWTTNATSFRVYDVRQPADPNGRVLMVLVYPDLATAQAERSRAQAREASELTGAATSDIGPHLVPGYGPSTLVGNVALVESTMGQLGQLYSAQHAQDDPGAITTANLVQPTPELVMHAVDLDFLSALDSGTTNL